MSKASRKYDFCVRVPENEKFAKIIFFFFVTRTKFEVGSKSEVCRDFRFAETVANACGARATLNCFLLFKFAEMAESHKRKQNFDSEVSPKKECVVKRSQTFRREYTELWPCIRPGKKGETFAFCEVCACDFSIKSGGKDDCRRHTRTEKHKANSKIAEAQQQHKKTTGFFDSGASTSAPKKDSTTVIRAEVMMVDIMLEQNLPVATLDKLSKAVKIMFPDSAIAKQFQCGRNKGTAIIKENTAKTTFSLVDRMRARPIYNNFPSC